MNEIISRIKVFNHLGINPGSYCRKILNENNEEGVRKADKGYCQKKDRIKTEKVKR